MYVVLTQPVAQLVARKHVGVYMSTNIITYGYICIYKSENNTQTKVILLHATFTHQLSFKTRFEMWSNIQVTND